MFSTRVIYVIFYRRIRISRISGNFGACTDGVYQSLLSDHEREPGFEAKLLLYFDSIVAAMIVATHSSLYNQGRLVSI